jgi:hypothetical protein
MSRQPSQRRETVNVVRDFVVAGSTLLGLVVAAALTAPSAAREMAIVSHRQPPQPESYFLAHDRGGVVDHHVLYHGLDSVALARMRAAQVLFLGNSRLMFALDTGALREFFGELGLTYYVLGFGHTEQDDFPGRIMARYQLRPTVVVVNADGFFWDGESPWATKTVRETAFDAWKLQMESEATHAIRRRLHRLVPHYVDLFGKKREIIVYRSRLDGTWFVANALGDGAGFPWPPEDRHQPSARSLRAAEGFKRDVEALGARLVLIVVPSPDASIHRAEALAAHLGVPLIAPRVEKMATIDGSHLSPASSWRFEQALLPALREHLQGR